MASTPNFLLIMAEHFGALADPNQVAGWPAEMPALRRLAGRGARCENAYTPAPVCGPARMSFLTGRYVCNHGAYDNGSALPAEVPTFAHVLGAHGYETIMCGRMHFHGLDVLKGFERRLGGEIHNPLLANPADWAAPLEPIRPLPPAPQRTYAPQFSDSPVYRHDDVVSGYACRFLRERGAQADAPPFCLTVGFLAAHPGGKPTPALKELYDHYIARDLPVADFTPADYDRLPEHVRRRLQIGHATQQIFSAEFQRHEMAWHLARQTYLDRQLGRVLDALDESGLAGDTVVLFTSDHGDGMGRHGLWGKMFFYEEAERIPFYAAGPGLKPGRVVAERVSLVDVLPTVAEWAGAEVRHPVDGRALGPMLRGERPEQPGGVVFSEYHGYLSPSDMYMAIKGDWKYCHYLLEPGELYNLREDAAEERDRFADPDCAAIRAELEAEIRARVDIEATAERVRAYNAQRQMMADAMAAGADAQRFNQDYIAWWRARMNDAWWDGGGYAARWEQHLYALTPEARPRDPTTPA